MFGEICPIGTRVMVKDQNRKDHIGRIKGFAPGRSDLIPWIVFDDGGNTLENGHLIHQPIAELLEVWEENQTLTGPDSGIGAGVSLRLGDGRKLMFETAWTGSSL